MAKGATPRARKQLVSKAFYLRPEPFCLSDKKQYTKQWFPTSSPPFPYRRAGRGRGSCEEPSLPGPPDPGSVESMLCAPMSCMCMTVYMFVQYMCTLEGWEAEDLKPGPTLTLPTVQPLQGSIPSLGLSFPNRRMGT